MEPLLRQEGIQQHEHDYEDVVELHDRDLKCFEKREAHRYHIRVPDDKVLKIIKFSCSKEKDRGRVLEKAPE